MVPYDGMARYGYVYCKIRPIDSCIQFQLPTTSNISKVEKFIPKVGLLSKGLLLPFFSFPFSSQFFIFCVADVIGIDGEPDCTEKLGWLTLASGKD